MKSQIKLLSIFLFLFIFGGSLVTAISSDARIGLQDIRSDMVSKIQLSFDYPQDSNHVCKRPLLDLAIDALFEGVKEDIISEFDKAMKGIIKTYLEKIGPIGAVFDAIEIYDMVTSANSLEAFKENLKKKLKEKYIEKGLGEIDGEQVEDAVNQISELYEKIKKEQTTESIILPDPKNVECNTKISGLWQKSTNRIVITFTGDCECKKYNTGIFSLSVFGTLTPKETPDGGTTLIGKYDHSIFQSDCPCQKKTASIYQPLGEDSVYAFINSNKDMISEQVSKVPSPLTSLIKGNRNVLLYVEKENQKSENIFFDITYIDNKIIISKFMKSSDTSPTLTITTDEKTFASIINSEDPINILRESLDTSKVTIKSTKLVTKGMITVAGVASRIYSGATQQIKDIVPSNKEQYLSFNNAPAIISKLPTNVKVMTIQNSPMAYAVNNRGVPQGYMTQNSNILLGYRSGGYSQAAGIYQSAPPTSYYSGGYTATTAFFVGTTSTSNYGGYKFAR